MSLSGISQRVAHRRTRHRTSSRPRRTSLDLRLERLEGRLCPVLTLTPAGQALGLTLSTFASGFPNAPTPTGNVGPLGIAFPAPGGVLVTDGNGGVYRFPTDADGQSAASTPVTADYSTANAFGLTQFGGNLYMTQQAAGQVVQVNDDGALIQSITSTPAGATGIIPDPFTGHLFVSVIGPTTGSFGGILDVDPVNHTYRVFSTTPVDGMALSADGSLLYAASGYDVLGFNTANGQKVFDTGALLTTGFTDSIALGAGSLAGNLFVDTQAGTVIEYNLSTAATEVLASGGSRGDFVAVDPNNGTLLVTQSDSVMRIGGSFLIPPNSPVPTITGEQVVLTDLKHNRRGKPIGEPVVDFVFQFSTVMDPETAGDANNYQVAWESTTKVKRRAVKVFHPVLVSATYDSSNHSVTVATLIKRKEFAHGGQVTVTASPPGGVSSAAGAFLSRETIFTVAANASSIA
jgi:sugar lactone lactonase YvrE